MRFSFPLSLRRAACKSSAFAYCRKPRLLPPPSRRVSKYSHPVLRDCTSCIILLVDSVRGAVKRIPRLQFSLLGAIFSLEPSSESPSVWLAIATVTGLPLVLWAYKIIYMGYAPLGVRTEKLKPHMYGKDISCEEIKVRSERRVSLSGLVLRHNVTRHHGHSPDVVLFYLQGNAGNPLSRLPIFERLLQTRDPFYAPSSTPDLDVAIMSIAPRSYWTSSSRSPTERGFLIDYKAALDYTVDRFPHSPIVLYGHSLGGAVVVCLAAQLQRAQYRAVKGLVLENPFASIAGMVTALYPQRWLPYHYLAPLAFDKWDALKAMRNIGAHPDSLLASLSRDMLVLLSEKDEVVPPTMGGEIWEASQKQCALETDHTLRMGQKVIIRNALHEDAWNKRQWLTEMMKYMQLVHKSSVNTSKSSSCRHAPC